MGETTEISWCHHTFNPWIGCTKVSAACDHCYAETLAKRYGWANWGHGEPRRMAAPSTWKHPRKWNKAAAAAGVRKRVFCASLADVFDVEVDDNWRVLLMEEILATPSLDWLLLTKRPQVALKWFTDAPAPRNVWLGTTVEDQKMADLRVPILLSVPDIKVRFLSCEPLLGPIVLDHAALTGLDWLIAGGESGRGARPMHPDWARSLRDQCHAASVAFHFKQWGEHSPAELIEDGIDPDTPWRREPDGRVSWAVDELRTPKPWPKVQHWRVGKDRSGAMLDGREWREFPEATHG